MFKAHSPTATATDPTATISPHNKDSDAYPLTAAAPADFDVEAGVLDPVDVPVEEPVAAPVEEAPEEPEAAVAPDPAIVESAASVVKAAVRPV